MSAKASHGARKVSRSPVAVSVVAAKLRHRPPHAAASRLRSRRAAQALADFLEAHRTIRDGDGEDRAATGALDQFQHPAMGADELVRDRETEAGAAAAGGSAEGGEQVLSRLGRQAWAGVGD